ncbi:hypothetical protein D3C81_2161290 [compost metagenome]
MGLERKSIERATSSTLPKRPKGISERVFSYSSGMASLIIDQLPPGYSTGPGEIMLTRMFFAAHSCESCLP